jgi:E3 ubiquitin-protein ligase TRIP12
MSKDNSSQGEVPALARGASEQALGMLVEQHERAPCGLRFQSSRLNSAVIAASRDLLACAAGALPSWVLGVASHAPWLLPLATRRLLLERSAFGALASLGDVQLSQGNKGYSYDGNQSVFQFGRVPRAKIRVRRDQIWQTARSAMQMYAGVRSQLEVEYFGEVGVGLGPTLEFWTLVSREMQLQSLGLWLDSSANPNGGGHCVAPGASGLFPRPRQEASEEWELAGTLMGKAMLDGRLLDVPLSPLFWRVMLGEGPAPGLADLESVYPEAYNVLAELAKGAAARYDASDLGLSLTLAGRDDWELVPGGASIPLTRENAAL